MGAKLAKLNIVCLSQDKYCGGLASSDNELQYFMNYNSVICRVNYLRNTLFVHAVVQFKKICNLKKKN